MMKKHEDALEDLKKAREQDPDDKAILSKFLVSLLMPVLIT